MENTFGHSIHSVCPFCGNEKRELLIFKYEHRTRISRVYVSSQIKFETKHIKWKKPCEVRLN